MKLGNNNNNNYLNQMSEAEWLMFPTANQLSFTAVSSRPTMIKIFHVRKLTS